MATLPSPPQELTPEQLFLGHLKLIESVAAHLARRCRFSKEETEDFASVVKLRLLEDDYAVIRKFQGKSTFATYLNMVVNHLMLDYRNHVWGKWHASAEAKRLGPAACRLEVLLKREEMPFEEACEYLRTNERVALSPDELAELAARLPQRNPPRRQTGEEELAERPAEGETPEEHVLRLEAAGRRKQTLATLRQALAGMPDEDRVIALLRGSLPIVQIAKALRLEQKPLYRRLERIFKEMRARLEGMGVSAADIRNILSFPEGSEDDS